MAKCDVCGTKVGMFSLTKFEVMDTKYIRSYLPDNEIYVCDECAKLMESLKKGDTYAYNKVHDYVDNSKNQTVKNFIEKWEKVPDEVAEKQEQERKLLEEREQAEQRKKDEVEKNFIISTTPTLEGYRITKYLGILPISSPSSSFFDISLYAMSVNDKIKKLAMAMGGNAVVGMTYTTKMDEVLGIGTVVWIEKIDEEGVNE